MTPTRLHRGLRGSAPLYGGLIAANAGAWTWAWAALHDRPTLLGIATRLTPTTSPPSTMSSAS
jgi:hypothetical protein